MWMVTSMTGVHEAATAEQHCGLMSWKTVPGLATHQAWWHKSLVSWGV